jgi:hypothetical protein
VSLPISSFMIIAVAECYKSAALQVRNALIELMNQERVALGLDVPCDDEIEELANKATLNYTFNLSAQAEVGVMALSKEVQAFLNDMGMVFHEENPVKAYEILYSKRLSNHGSPSMEVMFKYLKIGGPVMFRQALISSPELLTAIERLVNPRGLLRELEKEMATWECQIAAMTSAIKKEESELDLESEISKVRALRVKLLKELKNDASLTAVDKLSREGQISFCVHEVEYLESLVTKFRERKKAVCELEKVYTAKGVLKGELSLELSLLLKNKALLESKEFKELADMVLDVKELNAKQGLATAAGNDKVKFFTAATKKSTSIGQINSHILSINGKI